MSTVANYPLTAEQQNALLELASYAMHEAECGIDRHCTDDRYDPELGWDPEEELGWLKLMPGVLAVLGAAGEEILIAEDLKARLERLEPVPAELEKPFPKMSQGFVDHLGPAIADAALKSLDETITRTVDGQEKGWRG